jgi:hypothetical protein
MLHGADMTKARRVDMGLSLRRFLLAGIISTSSASAFGQTSKTVFPPCTTTATEADRKAAQGAFAAGQGSFNEADYPTAITYWRDAYRRDCSAHALLLNLGRAYELKGDRSEAVNALETYLQRKPDVADADQIRRRIENLKAQMAAAEKPAPAPAPPPAPAPQLAAPLPSATPAASAPPPVDTAEADPSRSAVPLIVAAGGGALAIVGSVVLASGFKKVAEAEESCPPPSHTCPDKLPPAEAAAAVEKGNAGREEQVVGGILLGAGIAAVGGGLLWYFLSSPSSDAAPKTAISLRRATATPSIAPGYAGIALGGSF